MRSPLLRFLTNNATIGLVGASENSAKFGNIILKDLLVKKFKVIPINPKGPELIEGLKNCRSFAEVPNNTAVLSFVVPPAVAVESAVSAVEHGHMKLWFQPGTQSKALYDKLKQLKKTHPELEWEAHTCIMDETRRMSRRMEEHLVVEKNVSASPAL